MARETKLGLLIALAFVIVVGVLLSDQFAGRLEPRRAGLLSVADSVRNSTRTPVPTPLPATRPVEAPDPAWVTGPVVIDTRVVPPVAVTDVSVGGPGNGQARDIVHVDPVPVVARARTYSAQSGDTLTRIATKFLGSASKANRDLIVKANPDLQAHPDRIIVGKVYVIPVVEPVQTAVMPPPPGTGVVALGPHLAPPTTAPIAVVPTPTEIWYTVKPGDSIWRIASQEVGTRGAADAIRSLNREIKDDRLRPGMKIKLPPKPMADVRPVPASLTAATGI